MMVLLFTVLFNALEAVYEALYDRGKKSLSAVLEFVLRAGVVVICLYYLSGYRFLLYELIPMWKVFIGFVFVRFAIFDLIWNLTRGMKWNYYGSVKLYDRIMTKFGGFGWFVKIICGIVGICFLLGLS
jgi:hypothetical protein